MSDARGPRRRPVASGLLVFLLLQGLYLATATGRVDRIADELEVYLQCESLWERGSLALPQCPPEAFFGKRGRDGQPYAPYGPLAAFLALPHHALGRGLAALAGIPRHDLPAWTSVVGAVTSLATTTWAALAALGLWRALRALGAGPGRAARVTLLLGAGSLLWPYGCVFYTEAISAALLAWALAWHLEGRRWGVFAAVAAFLLVKSTNALLGPALLALALAHARDGAGVAARLRPIVLGGLLAALVHAEWNAWRFGSPLDMGYDWSEQLPPGERPHVFRLADLPRGLAVLLVSPGKGLVWFAPLALLALGRARAFVRRWPGLALGAGALWASALALHGSYFYVEGGYAFGPRHLVPLVPLLGLPLARGPLGRGPARAAFVAGASVALLGVHVSFVADQTLGDDPARPQEHYFRLLAEAERPPGRPRNRYRLAYCPWPRYARAIADDARDGLLGLAPDRSPVPGRGIEGVGRHLRRVRATVGPAIPAWVPPLVPTLGGLACLGAGVALLNRLRRHDSSRGTEP